MVEGGACSHKIDYVTIVQEILNFEGHLSCINGSKVMAEWVDFACWWSCIGKGLRLQSVQQTFFYVHVFFNVYDMFNTTSQKDICIGWVYTE